MRAWKRCDSLIRSTSIASASTLCCSCANCCATAGPCTSDFSWRRSIMRMMPRTIGVTMTIIFLGIKATVGLRVSEQEEIEGLDVHEHGYAGYGEEVTFSGSTDFVN